MSAIIIFRRDDVVHVATDGLTFGEDCVHLDQKAYVVPHVPFVLATRGVADATHAYGMLFQYAFKTFDELVAGIETLLPTMQSMFLRQVGPEPCWQSRNSQLAIAGWSQERQRCEAYLIRGGEERPNIFPPWKLMAVKDLMFAPPPSEDVPFDPDHVERDILALMEAQRRDCTGVGGYCQLTLLTEHAVTQRILRRWPVTAEETNRHYEAIAAIRRSGGDPDKTALPAAASHEPAVSCS
jgi:hypothetical protein